mmetsp:Transcript_38301/g.69707  ORF Transcript_38301/g.69707 Transcript_38301/m.69707 type:complete len:328 (-) Transcript_38301:146-1129(-)
MFPRCFALLCLMVVSSHGKRVEQRHEELSASHTWDNAMPGRTCYVQKCCTELSSEYSHIAEAFEAIAPYAYAFSMDAREKRPACGVLGSVPDIRYKSGPCGGGSSGKSIKDVLKKYHPSHSQAVVNGILEEGTCEQRRELGPNCWDTKVKSHMGYQSVWWNDVTYQANRSSCSAHKGSRFGSVSWSMGCSKDSDGGMRFRAKWHAGSKDDMCGSNPATRFDLDKVIYKWVEDDNGLLPDESPFLPRWMCMDIPTPVGEFEHRLLAYSFGPPPCVPPPTSSTTESTVEEAVTAATTTGTSAKSSSKRAVVLAAPISGLIALSMLSLAA